MIFPSSAGTCRDPDNFDKQWRKVRDGPWRARCDVSSFRKSVATMIDDAGLSARIGADQLGHAKVSMTQDRYMRRGRVHAEVAALLDRNINDGHTAISVPPVGLEPTTCGLKVRSSTN